MTSASARDERSPTPIADDETARRIVEALVFVSDEPVTIEQIAEVLKGRTPQEIRALLDEVDAALAGSARALRIEEVGGGFRLATHTDLAPWIRAFFRQRNRSRLSAASVETLAVVAYKQPITAPEIQEIRGVDPQGALKTLLEKGLIRVAGKKQVVGRPFLYGTSREFLIHFGLASIEDLPPIEDFERFAAAIQSSEGVIEDTTSEDGPGEEIAGLAASGEE